MKIHPSVDITFDGNAAAAALLGRLGVPVGYGASAPPATARAMPLTTPLAVALAFFFVVAFSSEPSVGTGSGM